jgi:hypothetical protein
MPLRTICSGRSLSILSPENSIIPSVTSPNSDLRSPEMAFRVVDLPAPLAPSKAVHWPYPTSKLTPLSTNITLLYLTSMLFTLNIIISRQRRGKSPKIPLRKKTLDSNSPYALPLNHTGWPRRISLSHSAEELSSLIFSVYLLQGCLLLLFHFHFFFQPWGFKRASYGYYLTIFYLSKPDIGA